jgi:hypothetical protein
LTFSKLDRILHAGGEILLHFLPCDSSEGEAKA